MFLFLFLRQNKRTVLYALSGQESFLLFLFFSQGREMIKEVRTTADVPRTRKSAKFFLRFFIF